MTLFITSPRCLQHVISHPERAEPSLTAVKHDRELLDLGCVGLLPQGDKLSALCLGAAHTIAL